tara:strand:- start:1994 stop:2329 length:336 start_codon:yes stop_codon:yes gene_type:complete
MCGGKFVVLRGFERGDVEADASVRRDSVRGIIGVVLRERKQARHVSIREFTRAQRWYNAVSVFGGWEVCRECERGQNDSSFRVAEYYERDETGRRRERQIRRRFFEMRSRV